MPQTATVTKSEYGAAGKTAFTLAVRVTRVEPNQLSRLGNFLLFGIGDYANSQ
jgi:hypothetical protein